MKKLILLFAFSSLIASAQPTTIQITKSMFDKPTKIKLSELVDDITYIKLETTKESLVTFSHWVEYSKEYIYFMNKVFSWDGKWKVNIGQKGRGPYEEVGGVTNLLYNNGKFYSKETKFIEYDSNGKPTKKMRYLSEPYDVKNPKSTLRVASTQLVLVDKNIFVASADAIYFVNPENFQTVNRVQTVPNKLNSDDVGRNVDGAISRYRDNVLYCNPFIDTISYVSKNGLQPKWVLQIDKEMKR